MEAKRQTKDNGELAHLLTLEGLPAQTVLRLFALADNYAGIRRARPLDSKLLFNIFFETSTRTRSAFEATAKQLGADVINLDRVSMSGETKKESVADTVRTVEAMGACAVVLRHWQDGAAAEAAEAATTAAIINGGDGCNAHPTQGLADAYTLRQIHGEDFSRLSVAIVGDVLHSRVARSNLHILRLLGAQDIRLAGPPALCPPQLGQTLGASVAANMDEALNGADVALLLRVQRERLAPGIAAAAGDEALRQYFCDYGLTEARRKSLKPAAVIMHPGPINRGVEIADSVADCPQSLILRQVQNGMAIRTAVLSAILTDKGGCA